MGWNLVGWLGPTTDVAEAIADLGASVSALFVWDADNTTSLRFSPNALPFLNTATELVPGIGVWLLMDTAATWEQPLLPGLQSARQVTLAPGFNLLTWTGPNGALPATAFGMDAGLIQNAFTFSALSQQFLAFTPGGLPFLNTLPALSFGEGVWVQVGAAAELNIPAALP